ncbi:PHP domain-containing protein [Candidatus Saccharibacteria bacterium]|nr:PHP domain-containing protein [Candidatus Saccharibacteria bacterium]
MKLSLLVGGCLMPSIELHCHSNKSDGSLDPGQLIEDASELGISRLSITDHDKVTFGESLARHALELGIILIPGVEFSTYDQEANLGVHVLGHGFDPGHDAISRFIDLQKQARSNYADALVQKIKSQGLELNREAIPDGVSVTKYNLAEAVLAQNPEDIITSLLGTKARSVGHFIELTMNQGGVFFVPKSSVSPKNAVDCIHNAGGVASVAHPIEYLYRGTSAEVVQGIVQRSGVDGLEVFYDYIPSDTSEPLGKVEQRDYEGILSIMAKSLGLEMLAGSDFHRYDEGRTLGSRSEYISIADNSPFFPIVSVSSEFKVFPRE